ncbi:MAG: hypothetical protein M1826_000354 [Phylliscum demangeonii]|nr:MAG: hypothetical protein M1826_000354 [Phylliscum demangeonii]
MTLAPLSVRALDELYANVNGDMDGILIVTEWVKHKLSHLFAHPTNRSRPRSTLARSCETYGNTS